MTAVLTAGMFVSGHTTPRLGIDLAGGTSITLSARADEGSKDAINPTNLNTAVSIIERRVNGLGVQEAEVQTQGDRNIIVNIPRGTNEKQARDQVGTTAELGFRPVVSVATGQPGAKKDSPEQDARQKPGREDGKGGAADTDKDPDGDGGLSTTLGAPGADGSEDGQKETAGTDQKKDRAAADDLQTRLNELDCTTKKARASASQEAAAAADGDTVLACDAETLVAYALGPVAVPGTDVTDASAVYDAQRGQGWIVQMEFSGAGAAKFADVTGQLAAQPPPMNQFAIVLDGEVVSAPSVDERLGGGRAEISGSFTQESSEELANILKYGALPLSFEEASVSTVSPLLGGEQLQAGLIAGAIGLALVVAYLVLYYRGLSLIAIASLVVSSVLTYTIMSLLGPAIGFALNLPAVCGAIVAVGITADSFIVYFERVRDEIREGRTLRPAVERAWPRARRTILVSDFVSFLAAAVLFVVSVGKVQGFAFTLGLTTVLDVVVVFLFTKPLMTLLARRRFFASGHPWSGLDPRRLGTQPRRGGRVVTVPNDPKEA